MAGVQYKLLLWVCGGGARLAGTDNNDLDCDGLWRLYFVPSEDGQPLVPGSLHPRATSKSRAEKTVPYIAFDTGRGPALAASRGACQVKSTTQPRVADLPLYGVGSRVVQSLPARACCQSLSRIHCDTGWTGLCSRRLAAVKGCHARSVCLYRLRSWCTLRPPGQGGSAGADSPACRRRRIHRVGSNVCVLQNNTLRVPGLSWRCLFSTTAAAWGFGWYSTVQ
ncbi:uncharacterized protein K460DRAFT_154661 [Cucurbitaria berberidis CBS 394.84]|uniref:Uncharacterized protein n=1 Tax=Cucurbitaria berberidis CBS 394.84 TaxID=1168544 RepID=A0A9P4GE57_9PLEO|nr:uncharacterized protein K460DRAFT_154661 [Cucurbitaria berberidis CBS 394.84]KAF1843947.1 hypothetical protein K460DRAFT_154661 [Cucurbitaria berberidis CBS 394.84]